MVLLYRRVSELPSFVFTLGPVEQIADDMTAKEMTRELKDDIKAKQMTQTKECA
jgi:hypothetical protein